MTKKDIRTNLAKDALKNYEIDMQTLANCLAKELELDFDHWVGNEIGGVACFGDTFIIGDDIINYYRLEFTPDEFFEWYYDTLEAADNDKNTINMESWKMGLRYE